MHKNLNVVKNVLVLSITMLTIISIMLIWINPLWFARDLPEDNFVNIVKQKSIDYECEDESDENCNDGWTTLELGESSASGIAISSDGRYTYVLSADHFCNYKSPVEFSLENQWDTESIETFKMYDHLGGVWDAKVLAWDAEKDLCLLLTDMPIKRNIKFAQSMPRMGEKVFAIAAPMGLSYEGVALHFEGLFSGCTQEKICYFTIPATGGSSGSLVYNQDGEVISMIQMAMPMFYSLSMGVSIDEIRKFLKESGELLNIDLI